MQSLKNILTIIVIASTHFYFSQEIGIINFNSKNGLPTNAVNTIFKDKYGFYWIGTQNGLCKYDGYEIEKIKNNPKDSFALKCQNILSFAEYQNFLIIGCENGLTFYDQIKNQFQKLPELEKEIQELPVFKLLVLNNKLYIAAQNGLFEYNFKNKKIKKYILKDEQGKAKDYDISSDTKLFFNQNHFIMIDPNLWILKTDTVNHTLHSISSRSITANPIKNYPEDIIEYNHSIYILLHQYGLVRLNPVTFEKIDEPLLIKDMPEIENFNKITVIKNKLYLSYKNGIIEYDPSYAAIESIHLEKVEVDLKIKQIANIDNNLFIATFYNGFYIVPISAKKFFNPIPKYINDKFANTFALLEYQPGKIMVGGQNKLFFYNILKNQIEKDYNYLFKDITILSIAPSQEKDKYCIGTWGHSLLLFDIKKDKLIKLQHLNKDKEFLPRDILSLFSDKDSLWCGTIGEGLYKYNIKTGKYRKVEAFQKYTISYITKVNDYYWIATIEDGLFKLNSKNEIILHLNAENKLLSNNTVYHLEEDTNYIYIATDNGLTIYDKKQAKSQFFYDADGLSNSSILSVNKDKQNNLWIETLNGITKMVLSHLHKPQLKLFYNYSYIDGLINYEYNQGAHCILKNNYLVYGGTNGIDIFNPAKIKPSYQGIPVYITSFKKSGKNYPADTNIMFKKYFETDWRQNNIQIEFTAINPLTSKILYKYKLAGYDDDYSEPSDIRYISYTGLPGGTYTLYVLATNHDGEWNTQPHYIYIKVIPPFWKTTWFIITSSVLVFGSIFGFNQYRTYQIKKRNKELEQKVAERTKELATKNHEILSSIEYAKRIQQAILPTDRYIQEILPNAFILYKPKDIVSGDFYWVYQVVAKDKEFNNSLIIAAVDCTGHGVPGALMSMIGNNLLNQIVIEKSIYQPDNILNEMNKGVQIALKQGHSNIQTNDGMDASIALIKTNGELLWAGANRPLVIIKSNGEILKLDGDKYPIGGVQLDPNRTYTQHNIQLQKGDTIYLFSDGYADQFGGDKGKKMRTKNFIALLQKIHSNPISEQKEILENFFNEWKNNYDQIDDVLVIGISYT